jgi:hypothetical protein
MGIGYWILAILATGNWQYGVLDMDIEYIGRVAGCGVPHG